MFAEPAGFDRVALAACLGSFWGLEVTQLCYAPVGFGTHHYRAAARDGAEWFVNVDELSSKPWLGAPGEQVLSGLNRALGAAAALRDAGLEFVHAPLRHRDGGFAVPVDGGYAVSVYEFIDGSSHPYGNFPTDHERHWVLAALARVHAATPMLAAGLPAADSLTVPDRETFAQALRRLGETWTGGPYAEPARSLLRRNVTMIDGLFARYDALVPQVRATSSSWVVTHGEPHAGNVMRTTTGAMKLIDWDTAALGPRERDLWMLEPLAAPDWAAYGIAGGAHQPAMQLYRLGWQLGEICGYTALFRAPHIDDANTQVAWRALRNYLDS
jgi:spectinomycin phosphotransferase